jgi:hypothetical protein
MIKDEAEISSESLQKLIDYMNTNRGIQSSMRDTWEDFRRQSS